MTEILRRDRLDVKAMHERFGQYWSKPKPLVMDGLESEDCWVFFGPGGAKVFVSYDPDSEPGVEWIHASMSYELSYRYPSYMDLKTMHRAVFGDGHSYQVFVPPDEHINITSNVLHLWGRLDGKSALPNFGWQGTI
jgi:hypothetical protein